MEWTSWSPDGKVFLVAHYHEGHPELYVVKTESHRSDRLPISLAVQNEEQVYDLDSVTWNSGTSFKMHVTINCNPFEADKCGDEQRRTIIRFYNLLVDTTRLTVATTASSQGGTGRAAAVGSKAVGAGSPTPADQESQTWFSVFPMG